MPANHFGDGVASGSSLISKKDRWSDATIGGALTAAAGGGIVMHGYENESNARMRVATATTDRARAKHDMDVANEKLNHYRSGLKVNRAMAQGERPSAAEIAEAEKPLKRSYGHAKGRLTTHERTITQQTARAVGARRVKRVGSGVLGAGASLGVLGAVMAERKRRPKVPAAIAVPSPSAPKSTPLRQMKNKERPPAPRDARFEVPDRVDPKLYDNDPRYKQPKMYEGYQR